MQRYGLPLFKTISIALVSGLISFAYAGASPDESLKPKPNWTGIYAGVSVIETSVSNSAGNDWDFTNAAFGIDAGYNYQFETSLILGLGIQWNHSPFKNSAFNDKGAGFYEQNQSEFFGAILANFGVAINEYFAILGNAGIGYLKTNSTGQTYATDPLFSDHSAIFTMPVVGLNMIYKDPNGIYGKFGMSYYVPTSQRYYSTVGLANATLRKGLFQADIGIGYYFQ